MALDRNLHGGASIFCQGATCHLLVGGQNRSFKDVHYKHEALEQCRERVRENFPGERPDCSIFAIGDTIVWEGPLPWE